LELEVEELLLELPRLKKSSFDEGLEESLVI